MSQLLSFTKARPSVAMDPPPNSKDPPPNSNTGRRGSLSLSQTLSLDWTPPPPPADLEQIHASSSQAPGLTSFSLGSPPPRNNEQLSLNKLYSRVKSFAGAMRDAVGSPSSHASSPTKSMISGGFGFGSEQYYQNSASRDSVLSINTSEGGSDPKSPIKSPLSSRLQLHQASNKTLQSRPSSRVSSIHSTGTNGRVSGEFVPPPALRKATLLASAPRTAPESIAPDTIYPHGIETPLDGEASADLSRDNSTANLAGGFTSSREGISKPTVGIFAGAIGNVMSSTAGLGPTTNDALVAREPLAKAESKVDAQANESNYVDVDQDYESASDETISDSSDDDVVMLHSKLPAGTFRGHASTVKHGKTVAKTGNSMSTRIPQSTKPEPLATGDRKRSSISTIVDSKLPSDTTILTSDTRTPPPPPFPANSSHTSLPQYSGRLSNYSQPKATSDLTLASAVVRNTSEGVVRTKRPPPVTRISTDQTSLLPSFRLGDRGSETDSSPAGTQMGGPSTTDGGANSSLQSLNKQGFDNHGSTRNASGTHGGGLTGSTEAVSQALRQLRKGNLTRDFWMKDEVCKDCFLCNATFTAWRRKHHCRLCGQIFCSKCTTLISGDKFSHQGSMRVCSPCLEVVNDYQDESEEEEVSPDIVYQPPRAAENTTTSKEPASGGYHMPKSLRPGQTPLMAIPATRRTAANNPNRRSQILEIDADLPSPPRPTSARSMNALSRPVTAGSTKALFGSTAAQQSQSPHHGHKHSRSQHRLNGFPTPDERSYRHNNEDKRQSKLLPAFQADNILDPDLAPYMSDDDLSDDQQLSIFATIAPRISEPPVAPNSESGSRHPVPASTKKGDKVVGGGGSTASARARRAKSKSRGSISGLHAIVGGESVGNKNGHQRSNRRRAQSFIAPLQQRPQTRGKSRGLMRSINDPNNSPSTATAPGTPVAASPRASRSASMRGPLAPTIELNTASLEHVKKLLKQLLDDAEVPNVDQWERALVPILLKCTDDLNPDIRAGDDIDIRHYVKVKRIPGGKPGDTSYVSGVVFTKNLALKSMSRNIPHPKIVVVSFPIEYQRHQMQLMSLEPVIAQEKEFLQNMINRIVALRPTLLLVEKNVSGLALQLLAQANIATAYLVKSSVIEAVSRCAQADIFSSIDKLALSNFRLGKCASFDVKTYVSNDIPGRKKTFMYLSGCQKELGCTIILRGAPTNILAVIKQITELMVYVVYNLKLETCLMRDEFVVTPSLPTGPVAPIPTQKPGILKTPEPGSKTTTPEPGEASEEKTVASDQELGDSEEKTQARVKGEAIVNITEHTVDQTDKDDGEAEASNKPMIESPVAAQPEPKPTVPFSNNELPDDIPNPTYYEDMVRKHETKILSASPFVSYMQPYLLTRARELERRLVYLRRLRDSLPPTEDEISKKPLESAEKVDNLGSNKINTEGDDSEKPKSEDSMPEVTDPEKVTLVPETSRETFQLVNPEAVHGDVKQGTKKATEVLRAIYDAEYDKALHVYETQKRQWENYLSQYDDLFDPFAHQSITILYSMVCTVTTVPCEGPEIRRLEFYYQDNDWTLGRSDCSLGQFIEYLCETADDMCGSSSCHRKMIEHHRSYVHGQARVSSLVSDQIACPIQGMQNTILMWSYCKICPSANTPAIPMSESSWKYSFGKYLELSFWSSEMKMRSGSCPHDLNKDHVSCFGYHGLTVVFQYDPIDLLEIVVPRTKITYKPEIDLRVKNENYIHNEEKINKFFNSVQARLRSINIKSVGAELHDECKHEIEILSARADTDHTWLISKLQEKYNKSKYFEIVPLNRALRALQEKVVEWDDQFTAFDSNYFPSEKDIRRLATLQLKKIFLDNASSSSLQSDTETTQERDGELSRAPSIDGANTPDTSSAHPPLNLSSDQAHDVLASVVEEDQGKEKEKEDSTVQKEIDLKAASTLALRSPTKSDDSSIHTITPDIMSSQELSTELHDDDQTPRQELPLSQALAGGPISPTGMQISVSQPTSPASEIPPKHRSSPNIIQTTEVEPTIPIAKKPEKDASRPKLTHMSSIPVPDGKTRRRPPLKLGRTVSVPEVPRRRDLAGPVDRRSPTLPLKKLSDGFRTGKAADKAKADKKLDRFRLSTLSKKSDKIESSIPRSIPNMNRRTPKVSSLAKHFEQLSKEFERERAREKRQLAAKRARALPVATSRPIVEVYRSVREAVEEDSDEDVSAETEDSHSGPTRETSTLTESSGATFKTISPIISRDASMIPHEDDIQPSTTEHVTPSQSQSDVDASDGEMSIASDIENAPVPSITDVLPSNTEVPLDVSIELPRQHKSAWMKMLSNFWAERSASGWTSLEYPLHPTDHVFNDSDIIVREDEPSSLIAFALDCEDYLGKLQDIRNSDYSHIGTSRPMSSEEELHRPSFDVAEHPELERSLLKTTGTHLKYQFQEGTAKMFCKIFYAEQFDALRRNCGIADRYVESLSRCTKWDNKGGKSRSVFLKSQDERIVLKSLSPVETTAFVKFAPSYFQFMSEAFFHELPTVIAKMLGFYQIYMRNPTTGTEIRWDILVMENLFYDRKTKRIFDLKGSMRNRYTQATGDQNEVLLDENMVEFIYESPLFVREHSKKLLRASLWNDTLFLSKHHVMDYSLMIGIDEDRKELVVGIIDCIRTFTWDKKLESWVKEKGLAGGGRNKPTVTSPKEYKHRFREAMERYVLEAPSCWHLFRMNYMGAVPLHLYHSRESVSVFSREDTQESIQRMAIS